MSIKIMAEVYESDLTDVYELSVMLALANHSDDDGRCYPSIARIARLSRMKERGVQNVIRRLSERGYLKIEIGGGRGGTNVYTLSTKPASSAPIQAEETPHPVHPAHDAPRIPRHETPHPTTLNPAPGAPETSVNIKEPSSKKKARKSSMPDDAQISDAMLSIAKLERISNDEALAQFDAFKGYALANGRTYANWDAAWRNWLRSPYFKPLTGGRNDNRSSRTTAAPVRRGGTAHDSLLDGFGLFTACDDGRGEPTGGSGPQAFRTGGEAMDCGPCGYDAFPILRVVGSN